MKKIVLLVLAAIGLAQVESVRADGDKVQMIKEFAHTNPKAFAALALSTGYVACKVVGSACNLVAKAYENAANAACKEVQLIAKTVSNCPIMMTAGTSACLYWMYNTQFAK